ncbi:hypothetical protein NEOKW01_1698 [Nematocida sp. AWRm80]|nr:hypothetical protein NEOKW01_1698 [Nematocida sp. AWRm80]
MKYSFEQEIFSVESIGNSENIVVLLNGTVYLIRDNTVNRIVELNEIVRHTQICNNRLYIVTVNGVYLLNESNKIVLFKRIDGSKIVAIGVSNDYKIVVLGDYEGKIIVFNNEDEYTYQEHEDMIMGIIVTKTNIISASEDGIVNKTRIDSTEPKDTYDIRSAIRYMGVYKNDYLIVDALGSTYVFDKKNNDFTRYKKVLPKVTEVYTILDDIYTMHNNSYCKLVSSGEIERLELPSIRVDGIYSLNSKIMPYSGHELIDWSLKAKEVDDFFDDL